MRPVMILNNMIVILRSDLLNLIKSREQWSRVGLIISESEVTSDNVTLLHSAISPWSQTTDETHSHLFSQHCPMKVNIVQYLCT